MFGICFKLLWYVVGMVLVEFLSSVGSTLLCSVWLWYFLVCFYCSLGMVPVLVQYYYGKLLAWICYYFCMVLILFPILCWYGAGMGMAWFSYSFSLVLILRRYDSCTFLVFL